MWASYHYDPDRKEKVTKAHKLRSHGGDPIAGYYMGWCMKQELCQSSLYLDLRRG